MYTHAITRRPAPNFASGLTTANHQSPPDYQLLLAQHRRYVETLVDLGLEVIELPELTEYPDAYFVEDAAVVTPEIAVLTNPGAQSRRGEPDYIATDLAQFRQTARIREPGRLDGGDVMQVDRHFYIGLSQRTNPAGAAQLGERLQEFGYAWTPVPVGDGLHLKSSINYLGGKTLVMAEDFPGKSLFSGYHQILIPGQEAYAANTLAVNRHLLMPKGFPQTRAKLDGLGMPVVELDVSEVAKMDGGLTCLSLRF